MFLSQRRRWILSFQTQELNEEQYNRNQRKYEINENKYYICILYIIQNEWNQSKVEEIETAFCKMLNKKKTVSRKVLFVWLLLFQLYYVIMPCYKFIFFFFDFVLGFGLLASSSTVHCVANGDFVGVNNCCTAKASTQRKKNKNKNITATTNIYWKVETNEHKIITLWNFVDFALIIIRSSYFIFGYYYRFHFITKIKIIFFFCVIVSLFSIFCLFFFYLFDQAIESGTNSIE